MPSDARLRGVIHVLMPMLAAAAASIGCAGTSGGHLLPSPKPIFDHAIVPGQRIGPVAIGMTPAQVLEVLGRPQPGSIIATEAGTHSIYQYDDFSVFILSETERVYIVSTSSDAYATSDGLCVGLTEPEVRAKRGKPERAIDRNPWNLEYWYDSHRLELMFNPSAGHRVCYVRVR